MTEKNRILLHKVTEDDEPGPNEITVTVRKGADVVVLEGCAALAICASDEGDVRAAFHGDKDWFIPLCAQVVLMAHDTDILMPVLDQAAKKIGCKILVGVETGDGE